MPSDFVSTNADSLNRWFDERFALKMEETRKNKTPVLTLMVTRGTLDWAYPPFIIGSTAKALGWDVTLFFTFYGLGLLKKELDLKISALGNPAMPMKMPFGPPWFRDVEWKMPNLIMAAIPGFESLATSLMRETLRQKGVAAVEELRDICVESEVRLMACQMTVDLFGWKKEDFIPGISEWAGAATFLTVAQEADVCLYT
ncbi:MAG: DsrE/DsrF/DrsH-like family protein [Pseudomonadota bacterium]|nr:DsrE/DsrF/DrsH-like family protein [Pseudomonadota bacterium]